MNKLSNQRQLKLVPYSQLCCSAFGNQRDNVKPLVCAFNTGVGNLLPAGRMRPTKAFYPARNLLLPSGPRPFFNDRYAAINRRNDSHLVTKTFVVFAIYAAVKRPKFPAKTCFLLDFATDCSEKRFELLAKTFFFWFSLSILPEKDLNFWRRPFSFGPLEWLRPAGTLFGLNVAH